MLRRAYLSAAALFFFFGDKQKPPWATQTLDKHLGVPSLAQFEEGSVGQIAAGKGRGRMLLQEELGADLDAKTASLRGALYRPVREANKWKQNVTNCAETETSVLQQARHMSAASTPSEAIRGEAVLVRTHNPTDAMIQRFVTWRDDVHAHGGVFWVSVDTSSAELGLRTIERIRQAGIDNMHRYNSVDMKKTYPVLDELERKYMEMKTPRKMPLPWGFHNEATGLWFLSLDSKQKDKLRHVWIIEEDVGFTGRLSDLIQLHIVLKADLLTEGYRPVMRPDGKMYFWTTIASSAFCRRIPENDRLITYEHVQRFTPRLLQALHELSSDANEPMTGWSEMSVPTLASHLPWATARKLRREHIGFPFFWSARINQSTWKKLEYNQKQQNK
eukprot:CAMPEP_0177596006 /NCGR_PEP_ID=MMETSP0419_2-20121207/10736_1 /TAXON_ID=582737 /ORGANISM="Tetraselmis sp., Strain GSL018" /LENGTH=387 /DNA_ID=CAMNT_0019087657 /DNA_START=345 /DNA_END=1506 /DNA_ORIENTATION=-